MQARVAVSSRRQTCLCRLASRKERRRGHVSLPYCSWLAFAALLIPSAITLPAFDAFAASSAAPDFSLNIEIVCPRTLQAHERG
ncbi:hypothetical protein PsorP6_016414 [Peronosclerospora sorghi]|uniref:Uncharacterized protein n=1 Tax=Peronosclerospora sorghi TaxID=230839 RepID=A0ACC0VSB8_9STRA|nr:hypothetical protein PsorP6_016414 [Peronosclerospora sorghi]